MRPRRTVDTDTVDTDTVDTDTVDTETVMLLVYAATLRERAEATRAKEQARREEPARAEAQAARERLTPLDERLTRLLAAIPIELQREGLSLSSLP